MSFKGYRTTVLGLSTTEIALNSFSETGVYVLRSVLLPSMAVALLSLTFSKVNAQGFPDDFSSNNVSPGYRLYTSSLAIPETVATPDDSGLLLSIVHEDPTNGERAVYEINTNARNSISSTAEFIGARPATGSVRFETFSHVHFRRRSESIYDRFGSFQT